MPEFVMPDDNHPDWHKLPDFTKGYIEAMFFTECHSDNPELEDMTFTDIHPDSLTKIMADCDKFVHENGKLIAEAIEATPDQNMVSAGHDFWFTRNGHGVGFWENHRWNKYNSDLTTAADNFGQSYVEAGGDGKLHIL